MTDDSCRIVWGRAGGCGWAAVGLPPTVLAAQPQPRPPGPAPSPLLKQLAGECRFPWLMANVLDAASGRPLGGAQPSMLLEWRGVKLGLMGALRGACCGQEGAVHCPASAHAVGHCGLQRASAPACVAHRLPVLPPLLTAGLVEREWLTTLASIDPEDVTYLDFVPEGARLAAELRVRRARCAALWGGVQLPCTKEQRRDSAAACRPTLRQNANPLLRPLCCRPRARRWSLRSPTCACPTTCAWRSQCPALTLSWGGTVRCGACRGGGGLGLGLCMRRCVRRRVLLPAAARAQPNSCSAMCGWPLLYLICRPRVLPAEQRGGRCFLFVFVFGPVLAQFPGPALAAACAAPASAAPRACTASKPPAPPLHPLRCKPSLNSGTTWRWSRAAPTSEM